MHRQSRQRTSRGDRSSARARIARRKRLFPQGLILALGGWRLRPLPHHSLIGVVLGIGVVFALVVVVRVLRVVSARRRHDGAALRPVGRAAPRRAVVLVSPSAGGSTTLDQACAVMKQCGLAVLDQIPVRDTARLARLLARRVHIQTSTAVDVTVDGEIAAALPATFVVCDAALHVLVPAASVAADQTSWNNSRRRGQPSAPISRGPAGTAARSSV